MSTDALTFAALPNLHPALVHFPIALAVVALLVDGVAWIFRRREWLHSAAAMLYGLAALAGVATYLSGRQAANSVGPLTASAEAVLSEHADLALWTMIALLVAAVLRVLGRLLPQQRRASTLVSLAALLVMIGANGRVVETAAHGGELVYGHGVAVNPPPPPALAGRPQPDTTPAAPVAPSHLVHGADGSISWRPEAGDAAELTTVLRPAAGASDSVLGATQDSAADGEGLRISVSGATVVCLPGRHGDLVMSAQVDLVDFEGVFGLGHHIQSAEHGIFFSVSSDGHARLVRRRGSEAAVLDEGAVELPAGMVSLRSSVAGRHLKGMVGGRTVVHGHGSSGEEGAAGLMFDGHGVVRIIEVTVEPGASG